MPKKRKSKGASAEDSHPTPITAKERRELDERIKMISILIWPRSILWIWRPTLLKTRYRVLRFGLSQYGLTWDMVDFKGRMLNIPRTKNEERGRTYTCPVK